MVAKENEKYSYDQEIEVIHRSNELLIRHHFTNLPTERLEIRWPKMSESHVCYDEEAESCARFNEEATAFVEGEETTQSISYTIPKEDTGERTLFISSVFAQLHETSPNATVLYIADEVHEDGLWVTGLQQVGNRTVNLVNYTLFAGSGAIADLYWQRQSPPSESSQLTTIYSEEPIIDLEQYEKLFARLEAPHTTIVFNDHHAISSDRFIVTNEAKLPAQFRKFAIKQFYNHHPNAYISPFTAEILTAFYLADDEDEQEVEEAPIDLAFAPTAIQDLTTALTAEQITQLMEKVTAAEEIEGEKSIDQFIKEITNYQTTYFTKNSELEEGYYPFLLENPKAIVVNDNEPLKKHAVLKGNQHYYPIVDVMEAFGYQVTQTEDSLYVESDEKRYRFPMKQHFYVYNTRRYNTQQSLIEQINGELYFEESVMLRVFHLNMANEEEKVRLTPITI